LWDGSNWLFPRSWLVGHPSLVIKFLDVIGVSCISSAPPAMQIFSYFCLLVFRLPVGQYDLSPIIYWQVRIFICPPRFLKRGQDESHGTFQKCYLNHPFFIVVGDFPFIRGCRKRECTCFKTDRARFYCPLGLEIVGYSNKSLWIRPSLHMTRFHITRRLISIFRFHLKCFVCLTFRYYEFLEYSVSLARLGTSFIYMWIDGTSKIVLLLGFVSLSFSGRFLLMYLRGITT